MRERSHRKGSDYQSATKQWLCKSSFLGYKPQPFGDAYDLTSEAAQIGGQTFDFSLKLVSQGAVRKLLYTECKYRSDLGTSINREFKEFIKKVCRALSRCNPDQRLNTHFLFLSNVPPDDWRRFTCAPVHYYDSEIGRIDQSERDKVFPILSSSLHIMVVSFSILGRF